ncbi:DUF6086 family protein [Amycolatopsis albispora]|uniref:DUF6086 family protein n=1 Tax=Amycolatopsis albispora TaxID=1804986 RepID=UPI0013B3BDE0|nr:DUF6086 family protein [Amycolatopsis albispora]
MGCVFEVGGETVWSPASRVGETYLALAEGLAGLVGVPTGFTAMAADFHEVDIVRFQAFTEHVFREYFRSGHELRRMMVDGVLRPSVVMLTRGGARIEPETEEQRVYLAEAEKLSGRMPV